MILWYLMPMPKVKGHGEGEIKEVGRMADGRFKYGWRIWAALPDGSRKRLSGTFTGTIAKCRIEMHDKKAKAERSGVSSDPGLTVAQLMNDWLTVKSEKVGSRTVNIYRQLIGHVAREGSGIGGVKVKALTTATVQDFYTRLATETGLERTREQVHGVLHQSLDHAVRMGILTANPAKSVTRPRARTTKRARLEKEGLNPAWTVDEASRLHRVAMKDATPFAWTVAFGLHTGLRRGELFGLTWKAIDFDKKTARIGQAITMDSGKRNIKGDTKTEGSRRTIPLSAAAVTVLRAVKAWQDAEGTRPGWQGSGHVFCTDVGGPQHPDNMKRTLERLCDEAGIRYMSPHSLRHTFVSILASQGHSVQAISLLLSHKTPTTTFRYYRHIFPDEVKALDMNLDVGAD
jgi:integrase